MADLADAPAAARPPPAMAVPRTVRLGRRRVSPLTLRILGVNVLALAILAVGLLYLDRYEAGLITSQFQSMRTEARLIAGALGEGATDDAGGIEAPHLAVEAARPLVRRLVGPTQARARLYGDDSRLITDSTLLQAPGGLIMVVPLKSGTPPSWSPLTAVTGTYAWLFNALPRRDSYPHYPTGLEPNLEAFPEGVAALGGDAAQRLYVGADGRLVLSVAEPVQHYRRVVGVLLLAQDSAGIDAAVRSVRIDILLLFSAALAVTVLLSLYLAGTIARPIRRLAAAAELVRTGRSRTAIPDFSGRGDEIGDLSGALHAMTAALWQRMAAIEQFAADVAHEIKNPLTSVRSAVETAARVSDPLQQRRLLKLVLEDVRRLDRLITDIAGASRLDAELARAEPERVALDRLLASFAEVHAATRRPEAPRLTLDLAPGADLAVRGIEDRLVQILRNLIANAESFSPPGGEIRLTASRSGHFVTVTIDDAGPGVPEGKTEAIFERFYSERPAGEQFGLHSGLGLSISRQIAEAHGGALTAENRVGEGGRVLGARFVLRLPAAR